MVITISIRSPSNMESPLGDHVHSLLFKLLWAKAMFLADGSCFLLLTRFLLRACGLNGALPGLLAAALPVIWTACRKSSHDQRETSDGRDKAAFALNSTDTIRCTISMVHVASP
ncbi:MAG: hypothetical protein M3294_06965 [Pseudomonadota bacterium]|nr:hypothetical protein [Pseudomonadota bacterium]